MNSEPIETDASLEAILKGMAGAPEYSIDDTAGLTARTGDPLQPAAAPHAVPRLDGYELFEELGHGGMGAVYKARQKSTGQMVAVKVILGQRSAHPEALRRFEREIRILGHLKHPCIADLHAAGSTLEGYPYFAMELVEGLTMDRYRAAAPPLRHRLEVFRKVCAAVAHSHRLGVIHRDLKPQNVMVCAGGTQVKVLDFGLSRLVAADADEPQSLTHHGLVQGTLPYMSPEQINGEPLTTLSDVYTLGVILYELVTGQRPYLVPTDNLREAAHVICESRPRLPSLSKPGTPRKKDLDAVVLKALEKEPARRYQSVAELSGDIENYMTNQPVLPRQIHFRLFRAFYHLGLFCRRNRAAVLVGGTAAVLLLALGAVSVHRIEIQRRLAERRLASLFEEQGRQEVLAGNDSRASVYLDEALQIGGPSPSLRLLLGRALRELEAPELSLTERPAIQSSAAFSPDGARLLTLDQSGKAHVWDLASGRIVLGLEQGETMIQSAAFSPDGAHIVTVHRDGFSVITTWDARNGRKLSALERQRSMLASIQFSSDGKRLLATYANDWAAVLDPATGRRLGGSRGSFSFGTTSGSHATSVNSEGVKTWNLALSHVGSSSKLPLAEPAASGAAAQPSVSVDGITDHFGSAVPSPDGMYIATIDGEGQVQVQTSSDAATVLTLGGDKSRAASVAFSPDGSRLATGGSGGDTRVWAVPGGQLLATLSGPPGIVVAVGFSPDGLRVVTGSLDRAARVHDSARGTLLATFEGHSAAIRQVAFSPDGSRIVVSGDDQTTRIWRTDASRSFHAIGGPSVNVGAVAFSPDGQRVATAGREGGIQVWDVYSGRQLTSFQTEPAGRWRSLAFTLDGTSLVSTGPQGLAVWEAQSGKRLSFENVPGLLLEQAAVSPDGSKLYTRADLKNPRDLSSQAPERGLLPTAFSFDPASEEITVSNEASLFEVHSGRTLATLNNASGLTSGGFSPDGARLATGSIDGKVQLWDTASGRLLASLNGRPGLVLSTVFSPDGRWLAVAGGSKPVEIWDAASTALLLTLPGSEDVWTTAFSPDGAALATLNRGGSLRIWDLAPEARGADEISRLVRERAPWRLDEGKLVPVLPLATVTP